MRTAHKFLRFGSRSFVSIWFVGTPFQLHPNLNRGVSPFLLQESVNHSSRPPSLTALSEPASPWRPTHRYTSSGWEREDADTDTENDQRAYHPQGWPRTPNPSPIQTNRASSTRLFLPPDAHSRARAPPASGAVARGCFPNTSDLPLSPRDAEVGGWASRDRRGPDRADDARRPPLGRKKRRIKAQGIDLVYLISDLPDPTCMHANGEIERGYPPVLPPASRGALVGATPLLVTGTRALTGAPPRPTLASVTGSWIRPNDLSTDRGIPRGRACVPRPSPPSVNRQAPGGPHTTAAKRPAR